MIKFNSKETAPQSSAESLFRYSIKYDAIDTPTIGYPRVLYSRDFYQEREIFMPGLSVDERTLWRSFCNVLPFECQLLFANCYPKFETENTIELLVAGDSDTRAYYSNIVEQFQNVLTETRKRFNFNFTNMRFIPQMQKPMVGMSPKYHPKLANFNGMNAVKRYLFNNFIPKGCIEIIVYDNLCYHSDNEICRWTKQDFAAWEWVKQSKDVKTANLKSPLENQSNNHFPKNSESDLKKVRLMLEKFEKAGRGGNLTTPNDFINGLDSSPK